MKKQNKNIIVIGLITLAFIQSICIYYITSTEKIIKSENIKSAIQEKHYKTLQEINNELKPLDKIQILEGNEIDGKWYIKVSIEGQKKEILEYLSYLSNYAINNYKIVHNKDKSSLIIELSDNDLSV